MRDLLILWLICTLSSSNAQAMAKEIDPVKQTQLNESLITYASLNDVNGVTQCLNQGAQVNARNELGQAALHAVIIANSRNDNPKLSYFKDPRQVPSHGKDDLVAILLAHGADPNARDNSQQTPIHYAAQYDRVHALELLKNAQGDLNARNYRDWTPCHKAANNNCVRCITWLGNAGADMNCLERSGMSPLHLAVYLEKPKAAAVLLTHGARLDTSTTEIVDATASTLILAGSTVFHLVAQPTKNSQALQRVLLHHALFFPGRKPITNKGMLTFLCCLNRIVHSKDLHNGIMEPLIPYLVKHFSPTVLVCVLASKNKMFPLAYKLLATRLAFLKTIVAAENERGSTAYKCECFAKAQSKNNSSHTLLLYTMYDEHLQQFIEAVRTNNLDGLSNWNVLKAGYYGNLEQDAPSAWMPNIKTTIQLYADKVKESCVIY
ncbi:MAG: ankyrin repeat domain-containing protein [Candidatus Babeliales bacterium]